MKKQIFEEHATITLKKLWKKEIFCVIPVKFHQVCFLLFMFAIRMVVPYQNLIERYLQFKSC